MLKYQFSREVLELSETVNEEDVEFHIRVLQDKPYLDGMKQVQKEFEENRVHTDVLFYLYPDHKFRVIVRKDYYTEFVLELMKHRLLESVEWVD